MLSKVLFVQWSLQYHLFWLRIMKEHAIFIEATMPPPGKSLAQKANAYKQNYDQFLLTAITLSSGRIPLDALESGQYYTQFTEGAEQDAENYTGISTRPDITVKEYDVAPVHGTLSVTENLEQDVNHLNQSVLTLTDSFIQFQSDLLNDRASCRLFTMMYTGDILHVLMEAKRFQMLLCALQNRDENAMEDYKNFWTQNMADHAKVMRGQFDPTETGFFKRANQLAELFDTLSEDEMESDTFPTNQELIVSTTEIQNFKEITTEAIMRCKVQSIMLALYTDHLLREANHFLYLLK